MLPKKKDAYGFDFKFKEFSIKQAIFITDIFPSRVKVPKQKKFEGFFPCFLRFMLVLALFSKFEISKTFLNNKISNFCL